jgi:hypothetical protein
MSFGFSISDFVTTVKVVHNLTAVLSKSRLSSSELQQLIQESKGLESTLLTLKGIEVTSFQQDQLDLTKQAASQCLNTIQEFVEKVKKYRPALGAESTKGPWNRRLRAIQWQLCTKEELNIFRQKLTAHTSAINLMLLTLQM